MKIYFYKCKEFIIVATLVVCAHTLTFNEINRERCVSLIFWVNFLLHAVINIKYTSCLTAFSCYLAKRASKTSRR